MFGTIYSTVVVVGSGMTTIHSLPEVEGTPHANVFPEREPKTIRLTLEANEEVPPHAHPDREIVCYVIDGAIELRLGETVHELRAGEIVSFDGDQDISPRALEESVALLVLAPRAED